ncbi:hypothetical protein [Sporosarcina sp. E16_8]|uniref:hypothetical protein n=1 Tax=Sporosarcina sp. E16_8 TaxID=2789295 RepID=UPI001A9399A2|nr:hypothetical protein [Sporosarcina sp. E16_8]MBO0588232.1 hypothetical protein [Sporosarcina sp. E16_8]
MSVNWEKRYSFRLQEEDKEIYKLLQQVPDNKRSETIRQMLRFAFRTMSEGKKTEQGIQDLLAEMKSLKENQELQYQELLVKIGNAVAIKNEEVNKPEDNKMNEQAIDDSASAMLSSFGVNFD